MEVAIMSKGKKSPYHVVQNQIVSLMLMAGFLLAATGPAQADFVFGPPENLRPPINTSLHDYDPGLSGDGLCLIFFRLALDESTLEALSLIHI